MTATPSHAGLTFTPRLVPTMAAVLMCALTLYLAQWQQGRAAEKTALQAEFDQRLKTAPQALTADARDADALRFRRAVARGRWHDGAQIYIDNKTDGGRAGYHLITPLKLAESDTYVLVNRGWIARSAAYPSPPVIASNAREVNIAGLITVPSKKFLELSNNTVQGAVWQNLTTERYRDAFKLDVLPFVLLAAEAADGLTPISTRPDAGVDKHREYMFTWYALAATIVALWVGLNIHRRSGTP